MMSCQAFFEAIRTGNIVRARNEIEKLAGESYRAIQSGKEPIALWGKVDSLTDSEMRTVVGVLLELVRLRTRDWRSIGAIQQLSAILREENIYRRKFIHRSENKRLQRLLLSYIFRHPRDETASRSAMELLSSDLALKPIYRKAMGTLAFGRVFSPEMRIHYSERIKRKKMKNYKP